MRPEERTDAEPTDDEMWYSDIAVKPEGPVAAAIMAAGFGAFALGLFTTLAEASAKFKEFLTFNQAVGPLSGKTTMAVAVWLVAWAILHPLAGKREVGFRTGLVVGGILLVLGLIGTFPTFFEAFAAE